MIQWSKVIKSGVLATVVMELFYRATNLIFRHGIGILFSSLAEFRLPIYMHGLFTLKAILQVSYMQLCLFGWLWMALSLSRWVLPAF